MSSGCWTRRQALIGAAAGCGLLAWPGRQLEAQAPGGSAEPGGAEPLQDAVAFPLAKASDGPHLVDANGRAFLLHGDTAWSLIADVSAEDARLYLEDRRRRGFNTILVNLIENRFSRKAPRNFYDAPPFSMPGDFATPSEAYFAHADRILEDAARLGLLVVLTPAYLGYKGGREGWYRAMRESGPETLRAYGDFLGRRYARFDNIVWLHGGDFNPPDRTLSAVIAEAIRKQAPRALHSAHCAPGTVASRYWGDQPWLDIDTLYTYDPVHLQAREVMQAQERVRPVILLESAYENEHGANAHRIRTQAYQALLSGACGHIYGNNPIWHFDGPGVFDAPLGWRAALDSAGARSMTRLAALLRDIPWWRLEPDFDNRFLVSGAGGDQDRAVAAYVDKGDWAIVYAPGSRNLDVDTSLLSEGRIEARWYDPVAGSSQPNPIPHWPSYRIQQLRTPGQNAGQAPDWVLVLRSTR